jgi:hypothetical protein
MKITIGADELILWLRKNKKAEGVENSTAGRRISELIQKQGGEPAAADHPSLWAGDLSDAAMARLGIPKTSEQYRVDTALLPAIYEALSNW